MSQRTQVFLYLEMRKVTQTEASTGLLHTTRGEETGPKDHTSSSKMLCSHEKNRSRAETRQTPVKKPQC